MAQILIQQNIFWIKKKEIQTFNLFGWSEKLAVIFIESPESHEIVALDTLDRRVKKNCSNLAEGKKFHKQNDKRSEVAF